MRTTIDGSWSCLFKAKKEGVIEPVKVLLGLFCALAVLLMTPTTAHAYLDPGTGSQVFQLLLAAFVGISFTAKMFWNQIVDFFTSGRGSDE